jgi:hypothetical protein
MRKIKTTFYGDVEIYDYIDEDTGLRRTIIKGEPFKEIDFDDSYPSAEQATTEDIDFMIDMAKM